MNKAKNKTNKTIRRIQSRGNSLMVTIPSEFLESIGIIKKDFVLIEYDENKNMLNLKKVI